MEKMVSYMETKVNSDIEVAMLNSYICFSNKPESANYIWDILKSKEIQDVRVLGANCFTYYINKGFDEKWTDNDVKILKHIFFKIRKCDGDDLIMPRAVEIECLGLPVIAWQEKILKAYTEDLGERISWSFQMEKELEFTTLACFVYPGLYRK